MLRPRTDAIRTAASDAVKETMNVRGTDTFETERCRSKYPVANHANFSVGR